MAMVSVRRYRYRFPLHEQEDHEREQEPTGTRSSATESCGTCSASAVASCVALCCCPCAVVGCLTLAFVKVPYAVGRRCAATLASKKQQIMRAVPRKTRRVRDLDDDDQKQGQDKVDARRGVSGDKDCGELGWLTASWGDDDSDGGAARVRSRVDAAEKAWVEMYQLGHWGFGRLSFSPAAGSPAKQVSRGDSEKGCVA